MQDQYLLPKLEPHIPQWEASARGARARQAIGPVCVSVAGALGEDAGQAEGRAPSCKWSR